MDSVEQQLAQLDRLILKGIYNALNSETTKRWITTLHQQAITSEVYLSYDNMGYNRRYHNGGLIDENNFDFKIEDIDFGYELILKNITEPARMGIDSADLIRIINEGYYVNWRNSNLYQNMPYPRPFIQETRNLIEENIDEFYGILKSELRKLGVLSQ